jgi:hypothetical protein
MKKFKDNNGKEWTICLNIKTYKAIRDNVHIDIIDVENSFEKLKDPLITVSVLWEMVTNKDNEDEFYSGLGGDAYQSASDALVEEIIDFFPKERRLLFRKMIQHGVAYQELRLKEVEAQIDNGLIEKTLNSNSQVDGSN